MTQPIEGEDFKLGGSGSDKKGVFWKGVGKLRAWETDRKGKIPKSA